VARFTVVPRLRYFAQAREAAGISSEDGEGATVGELLDAAVGRHGTRFEAILAISAVWLDGEPCRREDPVAIDGEVAVLPPVSGGFA
jgi:molybdopterin synthase sulfur carrier subunit